MKKLFFAVVALLIITTANTNAQTQYEGDQGFYIEVQGNAKMMIEPNRAEINITLNQTDSKGKMSMKELEEQLAKALNALGIDIEKQLALVDQTSEAYKSKGVLQFKKYQLTVNSSTEAQNVFAALAEHGVKNANITRIWHDKQEQFEMDMKAKAVANAKEIAGKMASAIGQKITYAIRIVDVPSNNHRAVLIRGIGPMTKAAGVEELPEVEFQKITIEQNVVVRFRLL